MGNCVDTPTQVGCILTSPSPKYDRKEIYDHLKLYLRKSFDYADSLQQNFAAKVMQNSTMIKNVKRKVTQYSMMSLLTDEEAEEIAGCENKILKHDEREMFKLKLMESVEQEDDNLTKFLFDLRNEKDCITRIKNLQKKVNHTRRIELFYTFGQG